QVRQGIHSRETGEGTRGASRSTSSGGRCQRSDTGGGKTTPRTLSAPLSKRGHRPQRTCLGCGARQEQSQLIRLMVGEQGELKISRLANGRGGYLQPTGSC